MHAMGDVRLVHTAGLEPGTLEAARALLGIVFGDEMTDHDWDHALGGLHALAWEEGELVGHVSLVQRRLLHGGRALRAGYVEGVAVHPARRRRGYGAAMIEVIERAVRRAYELGALGAKDAAAGFYAARGWTRWRGPTSALTPTGVVRTSDEDGSIYVLPSTASLDLDGELMCDWREGDRW